MTDTAKTERPTKNLFEVKLEFTDKRIKCLLCSAFEGGSNYWIAGVDYEIPESTGLTIDDFSQGGKMQDPDEYWHPLQLVPLVEGCAVLIEEHDDDDESDKLITHRLDLAAIRRGLQLLAEKSAYQLANILNEDDDAITGDLFLQFCALGEHKYN
jgi:hypothetical protein